MNQTGKAAAFWQALSVHMFVPFNLAFGSRFPAPQFSRYTQKNMWEKNEDTDIRKDRITNEEIIEFIKENEAKSVVMADRIIGCPHEEGVDYPGGSKCPKCPFWAIRDRFTGETIQW